MTQNAAWRDEKGRKIYVRGKYSEYNQGLVRVLEEEREWDEAVIWITAELFPNWQKTSI